MTSTMLNSTTMITQADLIYVPDINNFNFMPSFYTQWDQGVPIRKFDLTIRNSEETFLQAEELTKTANQFLKTKLAEINEQLVELNLEWRLLKYTKGHFWEHCDYYRQLQPYIHFGTQVWLPPSSINQFQGGILITKDTEKRQILPDSKLWTLIILPLGVLHQITQVKGMRLSFVKPIYIMRKHDNYQIPRTSNLGEDKSPQPQPGPLD